MAAGALATKVTQELRRTRVAILPERNRSSTGDFHVSYRGLAF